MTHAPTHRANGVGREPKKSLRARLVMVEVGEVRPRQHVAPRDRKAYAILVVGVLTCHERLA